MKTRKPCSEPCTELARTRTCSRETWRLRSPIRRQLHFLRTASVLLRFLSRRIITPPLSKTPLKMLFNCSHGRINYLPSRKTSDEKLPARLWLAIHCSAEWSFQESQPPSGCTDNVYYTRLHPSRVKAPQGHRHSKVLEPHGKYQNWLERRALPYRVLGDGSVDKGLTVWTWEPVFWAPASMEKLEVRPKSATPVFQRVHWWTGAHCQPV